MLRIQYFISRGSESSITKHILRSHQNLYSRKLRILFTCLMVPILVSCGESMTTAVRNEQTGNVEFQLQVEENHSEAQLILVPPQKSVVNSGTAQPEDICIDKGISTIQAFIYNSSGTLLKQGQWSCSAHSGQLNDITAGSGYVLRAEGYVGGTVKYRGELSGISVSANTTTNAGLVTMTSITPSPSNQLWNIENFSGGKVTATHSSLYMSVGTDGKTVLQLANSHVWILRAKNEGYYEIVSMTTNKCLDIPSASKLPQIGVQIFACGQGDHQLWSLTDYGQGYYQIKNKNSEYCLDVAANSTQSGAVIQQYMCKQ